MTLDLSVVWGQCAESATSLAKKIKCCWNDSAPETHKGQNMGYSRPQACEVPTTC